MRRLFLGSSSLGSLFAMLASASGFALGFLAVTAACSLAFAAFAAACSCFLALLAACLLLGSGVLLVAVTAATYHCNGSDQNNE